MIITRTPFRISFFGGGSDISSYYRQNGGCVLSTSINKYMYIIVHPFFYQDQILIKYAKTENVKSISEINHPIVKQVLSELQLSGIEISSNADIPSGTGLGSSSAFTVSLLHALNAYKGKFVSKEFLAANACRIEIDELKSPIGKQDQYAAAYGGLNFIKFNANETVNVEQIFLSKLKYCELQENLILFYTGSIRSANTILKEQTENSVKKNIFVLDKMCYIAQEMYKELKMGNIDNFGNMLHESWTLKKTLAGSISNSVIDDLYATAIKNGAIGGKLLGAGGGGFLLFYSKKENQEKLKRAMPLNAYSFEFENNGSQVIFVGDKYWEDSK